ncbi:hypothetical protein MNBD_PLANCTO02-2267 [hydrothermal vent metagenome]|uniref:DNA gyrase inhibitor YacG n=1 Tax=hydrothermal vent metagenome TaxID=652676 RepID=A0A3B1DX57_9ZZZZ
MISSQTCPICKKELSANTTMLSPLFPFCSKRCKQVDLLRWDNEEYAVVDPISPENMTEEMAEQFEEEIQKKIDRMEEGSF